MASQPLPRYELTKLAEKLNKDYYPLTELLCKNAKIQAEWLKDNNAGNTPFLQLCNQLSDKIAHHLAISREAMGGYKDGTHGTVVFSNMIFQQSRESITHILEALRLEGKAKTSLDWEEMHDNLNMKLSVLSNLLIELFRIEDRDLIPLLKKNHLFN